MRGIKSNIFDKVESEDGFRPFFIACGTLLFISYASFLYKPRPVKAARPLDAPCNSVGDKRSTGVAIALQPSKLSARV